jgi:hypothetical protein
MQLERDKVLRNSTMVKHDSAQLAPAIPIHLLKRQHVAQQTQIIKQATIELTNQPTSIPAQHMTIPGLIRHRPEVPKPDLIQLKACVLQRRTNKLAESVRADSDTTQLINPNRKISDPRLITDKASLKQLHQSLLVWRPTKPSIKIQRQRGTLASRLFGKITIRQQPTHQH